MPAEMPTEMPAEISASLLFDSTDYCGDAEIALRRLNQPRGHFGTFAALVAEPFREHPLL